MSTLQEALTNTLSKLDDENEKKEILKYLDDKFDETLQRISENKWDNFSLHLKLTICTLELIIKAGPHMEDEEVEEAIEMVERGLGYFANIIQSLKDECRDGE